VGLTIFVSIRLRDSKLGRAWEAIREDEVAGKCFGINMTYYKVIAFTTGAFFGGLAGSVFAHMIGFIHPDNFMFMVSMTIMCMVIIGGMGNIFGVVLGAIFLIMVPERLREFESMRLLLFGLSILLLMLFRPQGVFPNIRRRRELESKKLYALIEKSGAEDMESTGKAERAKIE
jgi:branched-chain amino acid transport system permease protein